MNTAELDLWLDCFAAGLRGGEAAGPIAPLARQPGFAVYLNTGPRAAVEALLANHPAVARLVGEEWLRAAALEFFRRHPPADPRLFDYGAGFAGFLEAFPPAAGLPYLPAVARLDRLWCESHVAADARALDFDGLRALGETLPETRIAPHPAARWAWFPDTPAYAIWSRNRMPEACMDGIEWQPDGALLCRPDGDVRWQAIDRAGCALLDACADGADFAGATAAALAVAGGEFDLSLLIAGLVQAGALAHPVPEQGST